MSPHSFPRKGGTKTGLKRAAEIEPKYEAKLEFLGGRGQCKTKTFTGGVWKLSGTTQFNNV